MGGGATRSFFVLLDIGVGYFGDYVFLFCFVSTTTSKWFTTSRVLDVTPVSFCIVFTCFVCLFVCFFLLFFASISRLLRRPHRRLRLRGRRWRRRRSRTRGDQGDDEIIGPATPTGCVTLCLERLHRCLFFFFEIFLPSFFFFFSFASPSSSSTSSSVPIFSSCYCCSSSSTSSSSTSSSSTSSSCFIFYGKCVLIGSLARGSPSGSRWCSGSELKGPAVSNNNNKSIRRINQKWIQQHFFFANKTRVKRAERFPVEISRPLFVNDFQWLHLKPIIMYRRVLKKNQVNSTISQ